MTDGFMLKLITLETTGGSFFKNYSWIIFLALLIIFVALFAYYIWISKEKTAKLLSEHVYIDEVVGYSNYTKFCQDASVMLKYKDRQLAIVYVDVSNFKSINDFYGRDQGDRVLKIVADKIHDLVVPDGIFARRFADRFVCMLSYMDIPNLSYIIENYLSELAMDIPGVAESIKISCKCGIFEVTDYEEDINEMVDKAAIATKMAKESISETVVVLDSGSGNRIARNQEITYMMEKAYEEEEYKVYIQPKYSFLTEKIIGGEALVRWESKTEGQIMPGDFIPLFEKNGFVAKLDFYMLEHVCAMIKRRIEEGKVNVPISVNQSRVHVYDPMYISKLINTFDKYDIGKENIIFELTESAFTENTQDMINLAYRMDNLGYRISMDDFGCGYSSLNMLKSLPISELKLDKTFIDDTSIKSRYIIRSIVNLAHGLEMTTVCEGCETQEQVDFLKSIKCDIAQGFYYAKPMPAEEFEKLLDS